LRDARTSSRSKTPIVVEQKYEHRIARRNTLSSRWRSASSTRPTSRTAPGGRAAPGARHEPSSAKIARSETIADSGGGSRDGQSRVLELTPPNVSTTWRAYADSFPVERQKTIRQESRDGASLTCSPDDDAEIGGGLIPADELLMADTAARQHLRKNAMQHLLSKSRYHAPAKESFT